MKIAMVVPGGVDRSGEVRVIPALLALIERLARDHELHVFALRQERTAGRWELRGARVHNAGAGFSVARAAAQLLREHRVAPFDVLQSIFAGSCGLIAVEAARWLRRPACVHVAGGEMTAIADIGYGGQLSVKGRWLNARVLRRAHCVTVASRPMIESAAALGVRARRLPLGVDLSVWPALEPRRRDAGSARLIHVASLNGVKDQTTLLEAARRLRDRNLDFTLDIVGEDTLQGRMQQLAANLGLAPCVRFHGFLPHAATRDMMALSHLNVVSSRHEAGPMTVLEAAVCGVPTVGTAVGHLAEWAPDAALAVPVGDAAALADAIALLAGDDALRLRIAMAAQRRALAEDADCTARLFQDIYRELVG